MADLTTLLATFLTDLYSGTLGTNALVAGAILGNGTSPGVLTIRNDSVSAKQFTLTNGNWWTTAVPYIQPVSDGGIALDIMAKGASTATVWIDIVDTDITGGLNNYESLTLMKNASGPAYVQTNKVGSGTYRPLVLNKDGGNVAVGNNVAPGEKLDITGGCLAVRGNIAGFATAASEGVFDFGGGGTRVLSYGAGAVYGTFSVLQSQSNNTGVRTVLSVDTSGNTTLFGTLTVGSVTLLTSSVALTNGAAAQAGTLLNAPAAGNPTKWIPVVDNGTTRYIPAW